MEIHTPLRLYLLFFLFWGLVFFTSAEAGLFSLGRLRLQKFKEEGHPRYALMAGLLRQPRRLIITLLIGNEIFNIALSSLVTIIFISLWGDAAKWAAIPVVVLVILLPGEVIPKTLAMLFPEKVCPAVAPWIDRFGRAIKPLVDLIIKFVDGLLRLGGLPYEAAPALLTEKDFKELVAKGEEEGTVEEGEKDLIHRVFEFSDKTARSIMTPRSAVFALPLTSKVGDALEALKTYRFSRIPIYRKSLDETAGVLYAKDLLKARGKRKRGEDGSLNPFLHKAYFVPLSKKLDELFKELQKRGMHFAIVVDEYGKVAGVVTLEDVLEELFGEIYDELDRERQVRGKRGRRGKFSFIASDPGS